MFNMQQLDYCEEYPILSYTLNISTLLDEQYNIMTVNASESDTGPGTNVTKIIQDLPEDTVLAFRVVATNTFASVETNPTTVCKFAKLAIHVYLIFPHRMPTVITPILLMYSTILNNFQSCY